MAGTSSSERGQSVSVLVFGHSYVRDLASLGSWDRTWSGEKGQECALDFQFRSFPGKDYGWLLEHPERIEEVSGKDPDVVVVILGGNSITSALSNTEIKKQAAEFYALLKRATKPTCLKLAVQVEPRFVPAGNRHGTPEAFEFNQRRQVINNFVNKTLKKQGLVDRVIQLGGAGFINNPSNFRDGVHLSRVGLEAYKQAVLNGLDFALNARQ